MQEKFSVVLEAVTNGFKSKMNEAKDFGQKTANQIKQALNIQPKFRNLSELKLQTKGLKDALKPQNYRIDMKLPITGVKTFGNELDNVNKKTMLMKNNLQSIQQAQSKANVGAKKGSSNFGGLFSVLGKFGKAGLIFGAISGTISHFVNNAERRLKVFGLAVLGVRSAIMGLRKAISSYLSYDTALQTQLSNTWAGLGAQLAPIITRIINMFSKAVAYVNAFTKALFGVNRIAVANKKALDAQGKSAKSTSKSLSSLDEITNIDKNEGGGAGGGDLNQIKLPEVDTTSLEKFAKKLRDLFSKGEYFEAGKYIGETLTQQLEKIDWKKIQDKARNIATAIVETINGFIAGTDWKVVGNTIAQGINTAIAFFATLVKKFNWKKAGEALGETFESLFTNINWKELAEGINAFAIGVFDFISSALNAVDWQKVGTSIRKFIKSIEWAKIAEAFAKAFWAAIKAVFSLSASIKGFDSVGEDIVTGFVLGIFGPLGMAIHSLFGSDLIKMVKKELGIHSPSTVFYDIGIMVTQGLVNGIGNIWEKVKKTFNTLVTNVKNKMAELSKIKTNLTVKIGANISKFKNKISKVFNNSFIGQIFNWGAGEINKARNWISSLDTGTNYVPEDQLAYIHKGEAVVPKKFNSAEYFSNYSDNAETNNLLLEANKTLLNILDKDTTLNINGKELARTTYQDFKNEGNRLGNSSIVTTR